MDTEKKPVCGLCNDTHTMPHSGFMCTSCPVPCRKCANLNGIGAFCAKTPCDCDCGHRGYYTSRAQTVAGPRKRMTKRMTKRMEQLVDTEGSARRELLAATLEESEAIRAQGGEAHSIRGHQARERRGSAAEAWTASVKAITEERAHTAAELVQVPRGELECISRGIVEALAFMNRRDIEPLVGSLYRERVEMAFNTLEALGVK